MASLKLKESSVMLCRVSVNPSLKNMSYSFLARNSRIVALVNAEYIRFFFSLNRTVFALIDAQTIEANGSFYGFLKCPLVLLPFSLFSPHHVGYFYSSLTKTHIVSLQSFRGFIYCLIAP